MSATQPSLFDTPDAPPQPAAPDPEFARKNLNRLLRLAQAAEIMPWPAPKAAMWARLFPQLAEALPVDEARSYCEAFTTELARLRR